MTRSIGPTSFAFSARSRSAPAVPSKGAATSCGKFFDHDLRCPTGCFARRGGRFDITLCTQAHSRRDGGRRCIAGEHRDGESRQQARVTELWLLDIFLRANQTAPCDGRVNCAYHRHHVPSLRFRQYEDLRAAVNQFVGRLCQTPKRTGRHGRVHRTLLGGRRYLTKFPRCFDHLLRKVS